MTKTKPPEYATRWMLNHLWLLRKYNVRKSQWRVKCSSANMKRGEARLPADLFVAVWEYLKSEGLI